MCLTACLHLRLGRELFASRDHFGRRRWFFACPWRPARGGSVPVARSSGCRSAKPCGREIASAAPASRRRRSTRNRALVVWWSSTAEGNGTNSAAAPTAAISVTVLAPARQTMRSACGKGLAVSSMKGVSSACDARGRVVGAQLVDLLGAALVKHRRPLCRRDQRQGLRHDFVRAPWRPGCRRPPAGCSGPVRDRPSARRVPAAQEGRRAAGCPPTAPSSARWGRR